MENISFIHKKRPNFFCLRESWGIFKPPKGKIYKSYILRFIVHSRLPRDDKRFNVKIQKVILTFTTTSNNSNWSQITRRFNLK